MNDKEREEWVLNDEGLYDRYLEWKKRTRRTSVRVFVQEHRKMIDDAVQPVLDGDKRAHHLKYR